MTSKSRYVTTQPAKTDTKTFNILYKNPCIDPAFVSIGWTNVNLENKEYNVYAPEVTWTHGAFTIEMTPITHTLCGLLTIAVTFDGNAIDETSTPMGYEKAGAVRQFNLQTDDIAYIDTSKEYSITASLENYPSSLNPTADTKTLTGTINFGW